VAGADPIGPALVKDAAKGGAAFGLHQRIVRHGPRREHILVGGDDVPVSRKHDRALLGEKGQGMFAQPFQPGELVAELFGTDRVAVGQIDRSHDHAFHFGSI
jgi:hypothetical protein